MLDGVEVRRASRQKQPLAAGGLDQPLRRRGLMKAGVVQHDHAAGWQFREQHLLKIRIHHLGVATALKDQRRDQLAVLGSGDDAGAFPPFAGHGLINPLASGRATGLTTQAVIHAALVEIIDGPAVEFFQLAPEEPPLHLVALAVFYEFFLK
jgi:hypothetical protein